nr:MAG: capsid protein [Crogonang virus 89]
MSVYISLVDMELFGAVPVALSAVVPQSGLSVVSTMNAEAKKTKVVSKTLDTVSKVGHSMSQVAGTLGIPGVSAAMGGVSWLADKLAGTAKSFGYSKPVVQAHPNRVTLITSADDSNVDIPDASGVVAMFKSNTLDLSPVDGSSIDEMALPYVLSQYNQVFVGSINTGYTDGTFVYATRCCPTNFWFRTNNGTPGGNRSMPISSTLETNCIAPATLCYLGSMFRYFRGGLKFRFTFSKTKFHAGRVIASFVPGTEDFNIPAIGTNIVPLPEVSPLSGVQPFASSAIFDLKDDSVFEFEVPFVSTRPWLSTYGSFGGVSLGILDRLRTSPSTSSTIDFMVEVCAMPDFEFANYAGPTMFPAHGADINDSLVVLQSGLDVFAPIHDKTDEVVQFTMGEKVTSLKELIQVPTYTGFVSDVTEGKVTNLPTWAYYPFYSPPVNPVVTGPRPLINTPGNAIGSMYAFLSGGTTYHVYSNGSDNQVFSIRQAPFDANTNPISGNVSDLRWRTTGAMPRNYVSGTASGALHAKCPSFQKTRFVPADQLGFMLPSYAYGSSSQTKTSPFINSVYQLRALRTGPSNSQACYGFLGVAASDDAKCHHFIGPPLVYLTSSLSTSNLAETPNNG